MEFIKWEDKLGIGVEEIDKQHKNFFKLINELIEMHEKGVDKSILGKKLYDLVQYTKFHFSTEERYMAAYDYPNQEEHKKIHHDFKLEIADLARRFLSGEIELVDEELLEYTKNWIFEHILKIDKELGDFLYKKKVAVKKI